MKMKDIRGARLLNLTKSQSSAPTANSLGVEENDYVGKKYIEPPYNYEGLRNTVANNSELSTSIEAMEINIAGFGWTLKSNLTDEEVEEAGGNLKSEVEKEREKFQEFLDYCNYDGKSFVSLRRRSWRDQEEFGGYFWEVVRDTADKIVAFKHCPTMKMRLTKLDKEVSTITQVRVIGKGVNARTKKVKRSIRFRRFVEVSRSGQPKTYFKQYGDKRRISSKTGEVVDKDFTGVLATEIIYSSRYTPDSPYGTPRYEGAILSALGSNMSERKNYGAFQNNNIPALLMMVSGGQITDDSIGRMEQFLENNKAEEGSYGKFLLVESEPITEGVKDTNAVPKLHIERLQETQMNDQLFQDYDKNNMGKVRRSFRLPNLFVARGESYTKSGAETARKVADEQVFDPERREDDFMINRILQDMGMRYHSFRTNTPNVTNDQDIINIMSAAERSGGMTPRISRDMLSDVFGKELPPLPKGIDFDLDIPFSFQMAEKVKNMAQPNEVGQQFTALKSWNVLSNIKKSESELILNVGSQALAISESLSKGLLHSQALALTGNTFWISDGLEVFGEVEFGDSIRVSLKEGSEKSGVPLSDVEKLFPGEYEIWFSVVEKVSSSNPVRIEDLGFESFPDIGLK